MIVPVAAALIRTVMSSVPLDPAASVPIVQVASPVPPTAGVVQLTPGALKPTQVVLGGVLKAMRTLLALAVPPFEYASEYVMSLPAFAELGPLAVTNRPGTLAPTPSTYTWPQCPPCEQPAAITSS